MSNTQTTPQDRVRIFNRAGYPVAEFRAAVERSWAMGSEGRALFNYPSRKTDIVNENVLRFGNWLYVENSHLPAWVGVLDTPREWTGTQVAVHAYTPEHVFGWRRGPAEELLTGSAGSIFEHLLTRVNEAESTIIRAGNIWRGGIQREETINPTPLDRNLADLWERSGEDYHWRPIVDANGLLVVYGDWLSKLGTDYSALLHTGKQAGNVENSRILMVEDGDIVNDIMAYGEGLTWESRPNIIVTNNASVGKYGLRQRGEEYPGVTNIETLTANANEYLTQHAEPVRTFNISAIHRGDTFKFLDLGNTLKLRLENTGFTSGNVGYETTIRITGMVYDPEVHRNRVELAAQELL